MIKTTCLAFLLSLVSASGASPQTPAAKTVLDAVSFAVPVPAAWTTQSKNDEMILNGPLDKNGVPTRIWIRRVPPNYPLYPTIEAYMKRHTQQPDVPSPGWTIGKIEQVDVAGRKAERLVNDTSEFVPPESMNSKEIPIREEHVAVPASSGFYILVYSAPKTLFKKNHSAFAAVLAGFKPKL